MFIYLLTFSNGKRYVGQTLRTLPVRFSQHRTRARGGSKLPVHCAWRKYGDPAFVLLGEYTDLESLHNAERAFILELTTLAPNGYNVSYGGDTAPSKSPEVAAKIAAKAAGRLHSSEVKSRIAEATRHRWSDPEYRQKVLDGVTASFTPERRAHMAEITGNRMRGVPKSEEHKAKLRGREVSDETRAKMSAAAKLRKREPFSAETRKKIADKTRAAWQDKELTQRRVAAIRMSRAKKRNCSIA